MNIAEELVAIEQGVKSIKTAQDTSGDSAILYKRTYNPGPYIADYGLRIHTITCLTDVELDKAIFMPVVEAGMSTDIVQPDALPLRDLSNQIIWVQWAINSREAGVEGNAKFSPSGITIYANVPFVISVAVS